MFHEQFIDLPSILINVLYSIFAVPGLGSNAFGAWRSQTNFDMWLRDFLPDKVKKSRILIYGYNSDLTGPGAQSFASVLDLGKRFINDLKLARRQPDVRKFLFLVHVEVL